MKFFGSKSIIIAVCAVVLAVGVTVAAKYIHLQNRTFSTDRVLLELWSTYKKNMLEPGTMRTLDKTLDNITTSEGQSYTMLRAVWMDDRTTFDKSWQWTKDNLQRDDRLMSWRFGKLANGSYGVQTEIGGDNSATDGDSDIALSLLMAYKRWKEPKYLYDATPIIQSIWQNEVVMAGGKPVLVANNLEKDNPTRVLVNPSYLAPYAYKAFAEADPDHTHDWPGLADNAYTVIQNATKSTLGLQQSANIPPNWVYIDRETGVISPATSPQDTNYGYDAIRTAWRLALDWEWYHDPRAKQTLDQFGFLAAQWQQHGVLQAVYAHDGTPVGKDTSHAMYGASLGYFMVDNPELATQVFQTKLMPLYSPDKQAWATELAYYDDNWVWFGMALYNHSLPNLAEGK